MFYSLVQIKNFYFQQKFHNENCKNVVRNLFKNLFNIIDFDQVFVQDDRIVIHKKELKKIRDTFDYFYAVVDNDIPLYQEILSPDAKELESYSNDYVLDNYTANFVKNFNEKGRKTLLQKSLIHRKHIDNLKEIYSKKLIVSIDFEYNHISKFGISEMGITLFYPQENKILSEHITIKDKVKGKRRRHLSENFLFGKSKELPFVKAFDYLFSVIRKADFIIGHDIANEYNILNINPDWNKTIDTKYVDMILNNRETYNSLSSILKDYGFKTQFMHNSGNDARLTLELLLVICNQVNQENNEILI